MSKESKKGTWGGRRKGAGRKPAPVQRVVVSARVFPGTYAWLEDEAARRETSIAGLIAAIIEDAEVRSESAPEPHP